ncbi:MAG: hypothetical protein ACI94Y_004295, partial [Maribacter sp.]
WSVSVYLSFQLNELNASIGMVSSTSLTNKFL